jgi:Rhs element Vgr protein
MSSTDISSGVLATYRIITDGSAIPDAILIQSVSVKKNVNEIPFANIVVTDGSPAAEDFAVSSSDTFVPGSSVTIEAGYNGTNKVIFKGIVTKQSIRIQEDIGPVLDIECRDEAVKMIIGRKSRTYSKKTDSDIMKTIIGNYSGLSADITPTTSEWPEQVQYYATDWDFILSRAETNGMIATALNGKVSIFPPDADTSAVLKIIYGDNLLDFNAELNAISQLGAVQATSWDYATQASVTGTASSTHAGPGNLSSKELSEVVGLADYELQTTAPLPSGELKNWSEAAMVKSAYSKIQGQATIQGNDIVEPGKYITLDGLGGRFDGDHIVSSVHQVIANGNWTTAVSIGLSPTWFTGQAEVMAPPASGLLPGVQGLFNATVKKIYEDPDNQYRVLVDIPLFDTKGEGLWARLTNFYATSGAGAFFMPEVGDEVVVGFLNEDPRFPIILGSMYSSQNNKPYSGLVPNEKNSIKAIVSKSGISMQLDDKDGILTLTTPGSNTAVFSDKDHTVTISDVNSNSITMSANGITIKSPNSITVETSGKLSLSGEQGVSIESPGGDVQIKGLNIKNTADMEFSAEGSTTASLTGGAETTIKGAMVMIN